MSKKQHTNIRPKELPVLIVFFSIFVIAIALTLYCLNYKKTVATIEQICTEIENTNHTAVDYTDQLEIPGMTNCTGYIENDVNFHFLSFENDKKAVNYFHTMRTGLNDRYNVDLSKFGKSDNYPGYSFYGNYGRQTYNEDGKYTVLIVVENTVLYAWCDSGNSSDISQIINNIGYSR